MNRSNNSKIKCTLVTTYNNQTSQKFQLKIPTKSTKPNPKKSCNKTILKQSRKIHHTTSLTPNNNRQDQIVTNQYLQSILHPNQKSIHHEQLLNKPTVSQSPDPPSKEHTQSTIHQNTTFKIYSNLYSKIILTKEGSLQINSNNNTIIKEPETTINNNTIPTPSSKPSIPIQTHRKYSIESASRPQGCNSSPEVTLTTNQPHQECMNPYLVSISSLTIKNNPTETPPNQATNQFFTSTDSIKKNPHPPKMRLSKANPPQISTKLCNHNQHQISSSHSFPTRKKLFPYPSYKSQGENNKKEGQKVRTDGNQRKKSYAEIAKQSQCHQYKNKNSTKSPPETKKSFI